MKRVALLFALAAALDGQTARSADAAGPAAIESALRKGMVAEQQSGSSLSGAAAHYAEAVRAYDHDRSTAASALARVADLYRRQHQDGRAQTAQRRLEREFRKSATRTPLGANANPEAAIATAKTTIRNLLVQDVDIARFLADYVLKQYSLGAVAELETYASKRDLAQAQARLAAWDAGLPDSEATGFRRGDMAGVSQEARAKLRAAIQAEVQAAEMAFKDAQRQNELGRSDSLKLYSLQKDVAAAKSKLAQFDFAAGVPAGQTKR